MNATYLIDHLQAITHATNVLGATGSAAATAAVNKPKTATSSHYDAEGKTLATVSTTSYEGLNFSSDGAIAGGNLSHQSLSPEGIKLSTTSLGFQGDGKPASAEINIHNTHTDGDFKKVAMDMTSATWNDSYAISSGHVKVSAFDAATQAKTHDGTIEFDKETLVSGSFTRYDPDKNGAIDGFSDVDYRQAKFLGSTIIGGQYAINTHAADKSLASTSQVTVSSLGRPQSIETTNMASATAVKSKVLVDFAKIQFNARNRFEAGDLLYTVNDDTGVKLSETTVTYNNSTPSASQTLVYDGSALQSRIMVDFSQATFNNHNQVVNSSKKVDVFSADNKLISSTMVSYDQNGVKVKPDTAGPVTPAPNPPAKSPITPPAPFVLNPATSNQTVETKEKHRTSDNTLQQVTVTTKEDGKAVSAVVTLYGPDGTTVVKTFTMDLSGMSIDETSNTVSGTLNMQSHVGGNVLNTVSSVQY